MCGELRWWLIRDVLSLQDSCAKRAQKNLQRHFNLQTLYRNHACARIPYHAHNKLSGECVCLSLLSCLFTLGMMFVCVCVCVRVCVCVLACTLCWPTWSNRVMMCGKKKKTFTVQQHPHMTTTSLTAIECLFRMRDFFLNCVAVVYIPLIEIVYARRKHSYNTNDLMSWCNESYLHMLPAFTFYFLCAAHIWLWTSKHSRHSAG